MMRTLSFKQKLWLPLMASLAALLVISTSAAYLSYETRLKERKIDLVNSAQIGLSIVKEYAELARNGKLSEDDARKQALERLRGVRYGSDGYFLVLDGNARMVMHPMKPKTEGTDLSAVADVDGRHHYATFVQVATGPQGAGFVDYVFPRPGVTPAKAVPKLGYVLRYAPWNWILSTGAYLDDIKDAFYLSLYVTVGLFVSVAAMLGLLVALINRSIERTIGGDPVHAMHVTHEIAAGNLAVTVVTRSGDKASLMQGIHVMREALDGMVKHIRRTAGAITTATSEIASGNLDLSARTEEQAASLQETAASLTQLTQTVKQNADNAREANQLAARATHITGEGNSAVHHMVDTIERINSSSAKISEITNVIEGIAFQTNILALNAAVEAARAGEDGRGFAVVAGEVRSLAQRSASAAKEIKELIGSSVAMIRDGATQATEVGATMDEIKSSIKRVSDIVGEIAAASEEQSRGIEQVSLAVTQMDEVTQRNAALVEQAAAAAQSLEEQATSLKDAVAVFHVEDRG
ncbi:Methyl-accepting chemotaxis protein IV [Burkholderia glumae]|nr:Methyl-accepting chemotaxis protein IV [Burkholderia glumae]QTP36300.1 Methyl-accepting chemotaxis protein IV [Burkholderia glumae]